LKPWMFQLAFLTCAAVYVAVRFKKGNRGYGDWLLLLAFIALAVLFPLSWLGLIELP
jgi:uncharacterized membrane protein YhaH (DUF805 family)